MNTTHSVTGAVAGVGALPLLSVVPGGLAPSGFATVTWVVLWAGSATLPDMDHPASSPARFLPGTRHTSATRVLAGVLQDASGGHRHAMHYLWSGALACVLAWLACLAPTPWLLAVPVAYICALGMWICKAGKRVPSWIAGIGLTALAFANQVGHPWWVGIAIGGGYMIHILGDRFFGGCYSRPGKFVQYATLDTGGFFETHVLRGLCWVILLIMVAMSAIGWSDSFRGIAGIVNALS
jgi:LexA-binding, inner membrane-associated putative hydrolase